MKTNYEIWKPIFGFEGIYQVSNWGKVKSFKNGKERILKPYKVGHGYLRVDLFKDGKHNLKCVHRLVAEAFIPNDDLFKTQINHKDENKELNFVWVNDDGSVDESKSNLEWVTCAQNINFGSRTERMAKTNTNGKCSKAVLQYDRQGNFIQEWPSTHEVERQLGLRNENISSCCNGKRKTAYNFKWQYKYENE